MPSQKPGAISHNVGHVAPSRSDAAVYNLCDTAVMRVWLIGCGVLRLRWALVAAALTFLLWGCGDDGGGLPPPSVSSGDASVSRECEDADGDGFGKNCVLGRDCNDDDPDDTDLCYRCLQANPGCPCEPGTPPMFCTPPTIKVEGGILVCSEGTLYCRDGMWSECEIIGAYTFVPTN